MDELKAEGFPAHRLVSLVIRAFELLTELFSERGNSRLKKQVTNDRSAPLVSGDHSTLDQLLVSFVISQYSAVEQWATVRLPPNPTNKQTARDCQDSKNEVGHKF